MSDDMAMGIVELLKKLGYNDVSASCGEVVYTEIDGTRHRLVEDTYDTIMGKWISED